MSELEGQSDGSTWQLQHLSERQAVVATRGDEALGPGAPGHQLVQPLAGGQAELADCHPVVRGSGHHDAQPADEANEKAAKLETRVCHLAHRASAPTDFRISLKKQNNWKFNLKKSLEIKLCRKKTEEFKTELGGKRRFIF